MERKQITEIFSNFVDVLNLNGDLLHRLEDRLEKVGNPERPRSQENSAGYSFGEREVRGGGSEASYFPPPPLPSPSIDGNPSFHLSSSSPPVLAAPAATSTPDHLLRPSSSSPSLPSPTPQHKALGDTSIGDIFLSHAHFLKCYGLYVKNFSSALKAIDRETQGNEQFRLWIGQRERAESVDTSGERRNLCGGLGFRSLLLTVVQRIPRYRLLLGELIKYTDADHPDHADVIAAYAVIEQGEFLLVAQGIGD